MNLQHVSIAGRDALGRSILTRPSPADLLSTVSDSEAKKLLQNFLSIRSGVDISAPKAAELSKNSDLNPGSIFNYFQKRYAISTTDLPEIVSAVLKKIPVIEQQPLHRRFVRWEKARDFLPHDILLNVDNLAVSKVGENGEVPMTALKGLMIRGSIETRRIRLVVGRRALLDGAVSLADLPTLLHNAAMRDEAANTYAVLEANNNLPDGEPLFGTDNTVTGNRLNDIGAALDKFRQQKAATDSSEYSYIEPKYFIVPTEFEIAAHKELFASGLTGSLQVIASPSVTSSYLMAEPSQSAVLVRLALTENPIIETRAAQFESDAAIAIDLLHDYVILACNRVGVVRIMVTP